MSEQHITPFSKRVEILANLYYSANGGSRFKVIFDEYQLTLAGAFLLDVKKVSNPSETFVWWLDQAWQALLDFFDQQDTGFDSLYELSKKDKGFKSWEMEVIL